MLGIVVPQGLQAQNSISKNLSYSVDIKREESRNHLGSSLVLGPTFDIKKFLETIEILEKTETEVESVEEEARDSYGFTETDYRRATDMENFAPTLAKEFGLSAEANPR